VRSLKGLPLAFPATTGDLRPMRARAGEMKAGDVKPPGFALGLQRLSR
jgi:hypothetical protein